MNNSRKHNFIVQGSLLAAAGIICRLIGMLYRLPLVDIIGTKGNGYYTSAYSIYNILLVVSSYSLPTAISRIISERLSKGRTEDVRRSLLVAFLYSTVIGALMFSLMFFGAQKISFVMHKPFLRYVLMTLAPTIWIMAYLGILRGFFQGTGNMVPTAVSQIMEQIVNAAVSILMAKILFDYGARANILYGEEEYSYAFGAAGGTLGTFAGALTALIFFLILYSRYGKTLYRNPGGRKIRSVESFGSLTAVLFATLLPILFSSFINNVNPVIDDYIFSGLMSYFGLGASVVMLWGIFGEYRIIFNIPVAIANSLCSSLIPSLTSAVIQKDSRLVIKKINLGIRFTMLIAIPATCGLIALSEPICHFLFPSETSGILIRVLQLGAPSVLFFSLTTITNGCLQGLGHLQEPLINGIIALLFHVVFLIGLMFLSPGIYSVMVATVLMGVISSVLNIICIRKHVRCRINFKNTYLLPLAASVLMAAVSFGVYRFLGKMLPESFTAGRIGLGLVLCVCIAAALLVYFVILFLLRPFTPEELKEMPFGTRLYRLALKLRLM